MLYQPEIPPNTGNIIRLCANTGCGLHLIEPLGFALDERRLRRAGLDYHEWVDIGVHASLEAFHEAVRPERVFAFTTRAERRHSNVRYRRGDAFLFGPETSGLPLAVLDAFAPARRLRIPMRPSNRSLNLSNAVAVACYEAWRQRGFESAARPGG